MTVLPESRAAEAVATLLGRYLEPKVITDEYLAVIAGKLVAHRGPVSIIFQQVDTDPKRLGDRGTVLKQQRSQGLDDQDWMLERLHEIEQERVQLVDWLRQVGSPHVDRFDVDAVAEDREDARVRERRQDERAHSEAVRP